MKLKSFGCSHIYGSEMPDADSTNYSKMTWPALLARHFDLDYECYAQPGLGNLFIAESVLNQAALDDIAVFVINWSYINRFDYYANNKWDVIRPHMSGEKTELYFKHIQSDYRDTLTSLIEIRVCIDTLIEKNIPFLMTYQVMPDFASAPEWSLFSPAHTGAITQLQQYIRPHLNDFNRCDMQMYAMNQGCVTGPDGHILEHGHELCFQHALNNFNLEKFSK